MAMEVSHMDMDFICQWKAGFAGRIMEINFLPIGCHYHHHRSNQNEMVCRVRQENRRAAPDQICSGRSGFGVQVARLGKVCEGIG